MLAIALVLLGWRGVVPYKPSPVWETLPAYEYTIGARTYSVTWGVEHDGVCTVAELYPCDPEDEWRRLRWYKRRGMDYWCCDFCSANLIMVFPTRPGAECSLRGEISHFDPIKQGYSKKAKKRFSRK